MRATTSFGRSASLRSAQPAAVSVYLFLRSAHTPLRVQDEGIEILPDEGADGAQATGAKDAAHRVPEHERITTRYMTKYEKARILGTRALQLR